MQVLRVALLVAGVLAGPGLASAQSDRARALEHYQKGTRLYNLSEYHAALAEFKEAYKIKDDPAFLFNIAQCHRRLGNGADAIVFLRRYLKQDPPRATRAEAERMLAELESQPASQATAPPGAASAAPAAPPPPALPPAAPPPASPATAPLPPAPAGAWAAPPAHPQPAPAYSPPPVTTAAAPQAAPPPAGPAPADARMWLWVGLAAVVVAGIVVGALALSSGDEPACGGIDPCLRLTR